MTTATLENLSPAKRRQLEKLLKIDPKLIRAEWARRNLINFTEYTYPAYVTEPFHRLVANTLDRVVSGEIPRLMVFAPPQSGKSELVSVRLPAYWLGKHPDDPVILCSYAAHLAHSKSWQSRQVVESEEFKDVFKVTTHPEARARDNWRIDKHRGELLATGVGGPIVGHGAKLGVIDDPVENWEQARSEAARERNWEWYRTTFRTRIWKDGCIVIILTRWHEDDLAGRLLSADPGQWTVLRLTAIAETQEERDDNDRRIGQSQGQPDPLGREPGEALCPNRYPIEVLEQIKRDVGERTFSAQYQGTPKAGEGSWFKKSFLPLVDEPPKRFASLVRYWDKAASTTKKSPYSVGVLMGEWQGNFWVLDVVRGRWTPGQREAVMKRVVNQDKARWGMVTTWVEQEPGSGGKESAQATVRNLAGFIIRTDRPTGKKEDRAKPYQAQAEEGNVCLIRAPWNTEFLDEYTFYPNSRFKDQVDAGAGAFNKLASGGTFIA